MQLGLFVVDCVYCRPGWRGKMRAGERKSRGSGSGMRMRGRDSEDEGEGSREDEGW